MKRIVLGLIVLTMSTIACVAAPLDLTVKPSQLDGKALIDPKSGKPTEVTMAQLVEDALLASYQDEPGLSGSEKMKRFLIAQKIHQQPKAVNLTTTEIEIAKSVVARGYSPLVVGQIWKVLDPASAESK